VFGNGVAISTPWCHDKTGSLLWRATQGCAARHAQVLRIASHNPLWSYTNVLSSHEPFSLDIVPYLVRRSVPQTKRFPYFEIGFWIVGYNLFIIAYIIRQQPSDIINAY
jgi:hypothetical protein